MKLEIHQVTKKFKSQPQLTFEAVVPPCQTLVLIGPSGGGKSTLLRLLAGLEYPDSGWIAFGDQKIDYEKNALQEYRRHLGIVFQSWNLFPHLTALENIVLPLYRVHGLTKEAAEARSHELLQRFDLDKHAYKKPYALSGGQIQRVALIRAIAANPKLILLDEPTSALDPLMTAEVLELVLEMKKEGKDIVLVTHHLPFAKKIADQILFIAEGQVIEAGTIDQAFANPKASIVKDYINKILAY